VDSPGIKYAHLHRELLLMVGSAVLAALTGTFWSLNAAKAWVAGSWLYIPLTLLRSNRADVRSPISPT